MQFLKLSLLLAGALISLAGQSETKHNNQYVFAPDLVLETQKSGHSWSWNLRNSVHIVGPRDFNNIHTKWFSYKKTRKPGQRKLEITYSVKEITRIKAYRYTVTNQISGLQGHPYVAYFNIDGFKVAVFVEEKPLNSGSVNGRDNDYEKIPFRIKKNSLEKALKRIKTFDSKVLKYESTLTRRHYRDVKNKAWNLVGRHFRDIFRVR